MWSLTTTIASAPPAIGSRRCVARRPLRRTWFGVSQDTLPVFDGDQTVVTETLRTTANVVAPAQLAETRQVVVVHIPHHHPLTLDSGDRLHRGGVEDVVRSK